jgi:hypothetical protein
MADGKLQSTQKMPSPIRRQSKIEIHQKAANIFEENFFAELIEREEKEMLKGITRGREPISDDDFFEEHFARLIFNYGNKIKNYLFRKVNYPSKQKLIKREEKPLMNSVNMKRINQRREPIGQRIEPVGQRREPVGQRKEPMGDAFFEEHFARLIFNYGNKIKNIYLGKEIIHRNRN